MHIQAVEETINFYSSLIIILIIIVGICSLGIWYWSGRRPLHQRQYLNTIQKFQICYFVKQVIMREGDIMLLEINHLEKVFRTRFSFIIPRRGLAIIFFPGKCKGSAGKQKISFYVVICKLTPMDDGYSFIRHIPGGGNRRTYLVIRLLFPRRRILNPVSIRNE